ncbi:helix-turn-helix domain-containing protein [Streptomyces sp. WMMC500]|nr:helix-turn-helix domain-containing protein [Streptomyces sp. WMMC500]WBB61994.1 helix-turn-helix domain-containing protein [Streptomyces sp. WMMC500]
MSQGTVNRWRSRFIRLRLDGLSDEPRPGRPPSILLNQVEDGLTATLESTPGQDTHWSRALMAKHSRVSKSAVRRIWKKFDLKHHLQDAFKLSTEPSVHRERSSMSSACTTIRPRARRIRQGLRHIQYRSGLIDGCVAETDLTIRPT